MLTDLLLRDFRCFEECRVTLHPETTVFIGKNAQGKTSLMEAMCVLLRLQSPRTGTRTELIRFGAKTLLVEGTLESRRLRCAQSATVRRLAVDGAVCGKAAEYLAASGRVVWMDHRDMNLLRGGAEHRRKYLDFAASQMFPDYLHALRGYERALRGRNYILKRDAVISWRQADAYGHVMADFASLIQMRRVELVQRLRPWAAQMHADLSAGAEVLETDYAPAPAEGGDLFEALQAVREEESRTRQTATGPHRDDLKLTLNGLDATSFASEGQQRSLALALKTAQAHVLEASSGRAPLLLLDDVFGELDAHRRRALLRLLPTASQKVITTTHLDWTDGTAIHGQVYEVDQARIRPA